MTEKTRQGLIQIYTGEGKGKTTAALGLAMRAAGCGLKVCVIQFCKGEYCCEHDFIARYPAFEFIQPGSGDIFTSPENQLKEEALKTLALAEEKMLQGGYDLLILDEINIAIHRGFITLEQVLTLLKKKPDFLELVLTGRYAPEALIQQADLVTEMKLIKHPFGRGIPARKGIEY